MYEGIRSPAVHMPKTMGDLISAATRFPNAIFWAGGSFIMSPSDYYPECDSPDIIYLGEVSELKRINRTDRYLEIGAMVTYDQLLSVGKQVLPSLLKKTLEQVSTKIVRKQITVGGSLCTKTLRFSLSGTLAALKGEVEVKTCNGPKTETRWMEVSRLYDRKGALLLKNNELVTRIRVAFDREDFSFFIRSGSPLTNSSESVMLSFASFYNQSVIDKFNMCIILPNTLFLIPHEIDVMMRGSMLPFSTSQIERVVRSLSDLIVSQNISEISPIQIERVKRFVEAALHQLNTESLGHS